MKKCFKDNLREAINFRKQADLPNIVPIIICVVIFTLAYIFIAINFIPERMPAAFHFISERGMITVLSAIFLTMASSFSLAALVVNIRAKEPNIWLWIVLAVGFTFLSLDELLRFHENISVLIKQHVSSGIFRNWNDIIVILYGLVALPIIALLSPHILRYRMLFELFVIAFIFYGIHTLIDSTQNHPTTVSVIIEESAKLFCGASLALGTFTGFLGTLWNFKPPKVIIEVGPGKKNKTKHNQGRAKKK